MRFPISRIAEPLTVRLISPKRLSSLTCVQNPHEVEQLQEIENLTKNKTRFPRNTGLPYSELINTSFATGRPSGLNRFNGRERGAWYAALTTDTCLSEVIFHTVRELEKVNDFHATREFIELFASFAGNFVDLRNEQSLPECLQPDPKIGYPAGNRLAAEIIEAGYNGVIYPSVRDQGGTCLAALQPQAVQSVETGESFTVVWSGSSLPAIQKKRVS